MNLSLLKYGGSVYKYLAAPVFLQLIGTLCPVGIDACLFSLAQLYM